MLHLGAAEIVNEQILKPHPRDKQELPRVLTTLFDVLGRAIGTDFAVVSRQVSHIYN